ncbi:DUF2752 domain-containing protein [Parabacteroides goldsteinii]|uniref:DUF2752 domain-containing protein n=1 Tax=Parabacteroides goldsteinii TaxID=328812 RepID=UPI00333FBDA6
MSIIKRNFQQRPLRVLGAHLLIFGLLALYCAFGCPIYHLLGVSGPGCGLTRAWLSFLRGDLCHALQYHLLFLPAPLFIFLFAHREAFPKKQLFDFSLWGFAVLLAVYPLWRIWPSA